MNPLVLLLGLAIVSAQDQPVEHKGVGKTSETVQLGGNSWYEESIEFVFDHVTHSSMVDYCSPRCRGKKHLLHQECDSSCDTSCSNAHDRIFQPIIASSNETDAWEQVVKDLEKFGLSGAGGNPVSRAKRLVHDVMKSNDYNPGWKGHWTKNPCSSSCRFILCDRYAVTLTYALFRNDPGPDGKKILVKGPARKVVVLSVDIPRGGWEEMQFDPSCRCSVVDEKTPDENAPTDGKKNGISIETPGGTHEITVGEEQQVALKVECDSMTNCTATFENPGPGDFNCIVYPGAMFEPISGGTQNEVCMQQLAVRLGSFEKKTVPIDIDADPQNPSASGRFGCLNMTLKEPHKGVAYRYAGAGSPAIQALAAATAKSSFKGVADQVRLWIVTDHAPLAEIKKVLIPGPSRGMYLRSLYEVATIGAEDLSSAAYEPCVDPVNLLGSTSSGQATAWLIRLWEKKDPAAMAKKLSQNWSVLAQECLAPNCTEDEAIHVADVANYLAFSNKPELRKAAVDCLMKAVPVDKRELVARSGGLDGVMLWLHDAAPEAASALDVAEAYRSPNSKAWLLNCGDALPSELKDRAAKLYASLSN
jgi:hypothetical protein